jgi:lysyl endopeptidase
MPRNGKPLKPPRELEQLSMNRYLNWVAQVTVLATVRAAILLSVGWFGAANAAQVDRNAPAGFRVELPALSDKALPSDKGVPGMAMRIGMRRELPGKSRLALASLPWIGRTDGISFTTLEFRSVGAAAVRIGLTMQQLKGLTVYAYGIGGDVYGPFTTESLRTNGVTGDTFWLPVIDGDVARLELQAQNGLALAGQSLPMPQLSHLTSSPTRAAFKDLSDIGNSGTCNIDIACRPTSVNTGRSVAKYVFTRHGDTFGCTGTLLVSNTTSTPAPNHFLTARHCISAVPDAESMQFFWNFERQTCLNGTPGPPPATVTTTSGATLLRVAVANDMSLVRLNSNPPAGIPYAPWNNQTLAGNGSGTMVRALHHPQGDLKKYAGGDTQGFTANNSNAVNAGASHIRVFYRANEGTTEAGSSGAGIFNPAGELVGTLSGGAASCALPTGADWYGRFDQAYPTFAPWLASGANAPPPAAPPAASTLSSGTPVSGAVIEGASDFFQISTTTSQTSLRVQLAGLNADADLFVYRGSLSSAPICSSEALNTSPENCNITLTGPDTYFVEVFGFQSANYIVTATLTGGALGGGGSGGGGGGSLSAFALALLGACLLLRQKTRRSQRQFLRV